MARRIPVISSVNCYDSRDSQCTARQTSFSWHYVIYLSGGVEFPTREFLGFPVRPNTLVKPSCLFVFFFGTVPREVY